ncbi:hypothetical protein [Flavobacterium sp. JP2137]|uniref:hypothetical protein n=1 Tax=Flavobacterium sp. JP2137 TaxID=3414510 RepID=UPI003D2FCE1A
MSRFTLSLAERGENTSLVNLIKILRVLDAVYVLEHFTVAPKTSPILLAKVGEKTRLRASKSTYISPNDEVIW